jgi:hypothetical protein
VSWKGSPLFRDFLGFLAGGVNAAMASALVFLAFHPPDAQPKRHNHTYQILEMLVVGMLVCGGIIGRKGIKTGSFTDLLPSIFGVYIFLWFSCILGRLELGEIAAVFGWVTPGVLVSAVVSLLLSNWFPADPD